MRLFARRNVVGFVDSRGRRIAGWAYDGSARKPVIVEFYVDAVNVGRTIANRYRADLESVCPGGYCAFEFSLPAEVLDGSLKTVEVRAHGAANPLTHGRFVTRLLSYGYFSGLTRWILRSGLWVLSGIIRDGAVDFGGYFIPAPGCEHGRITVNGRTVELETSPGNSDWTSPCPPGIAVHSYAGRIPLEEGWKELHFSFGLERPFRPLQDQYYPLFDIGMPEPERRLRVHGNESEFAFNLEGYSTAIKLDTIAQRFAGPPLAGLGPVLDWGCGCGRVGRFVARTGADLFGVDIDADNILWCAEHISGTFVSINPDPPTSFGDNFFGTIYGISVFTHLDQHYEKLWLSELHRIAKPGALLLLSVLGGVAAARGGLLEHVMSSENAEGFVDVGRNPGIDLVTNASEYYRNVFHQSGYINKVWGQYFEILAIEEGIIGNHQDLVVARKPA